MAEIAPGQRPRSSTSSTTTDDATGVAEEYLGGACPLAQRLYT